jgi:hypothetical protein
VLRDGGQSESTDSHSPSELSCVLSGAASTAGWRGCHWEPSRTWRPSGESQVCPGTSYSTDTEADREGNGFSGGAAEQGSQTVKVALSRAVLPSSWQITICVPVPMVVPVVVR